MTEPEQDTNEWEVRLSQAALRTKKKLPENVVEVLARLIGDLEKSGPIRKNWSHFSSLEKTRRIPPNSYHCHIKSGRPTYVACWQVVNKTIRIMEIFYVGTHENAPY